MPITHFPLVLSTRVEPETYRLLVGRYRDVVLSIVDCYEGHVGSTKGDGLLAVFGHPLAHENDVRRALLAGLEITREVAKLSAQAQRRFGVKITVRVGVHRGLVYLDTAQDDVYGLAPTWRRGCRAWRRRGRWWSRRHCQLEVVCTFC